MSPQSNDHTHLGLLLLVCPIKVMSCQNYGHELLELSPRPLKVIVKFYQSFCNVLSQLCIVMSSHNLRSCSFRVMVMSFQSYCHVVKLLFCSFRVMVIFFQRYGHVPSEL